MEFANGRADRQRDAGRVEARLRVALDTRVGAPQSEVLTEPAAAAAG
jgi:hypothetical protein